MALAFVCSWQLRNSNHFHIVKPYKWGIWGISTIGAPILLELLAFTRPLPSGFIDAVIILGNVFICLAIGSRGLRLDTTTGLTAVIVAISLITGLATNAITAPFAAFLNLLPVFLIPATRLSIEGFRVAILSASTFGFLSLSLLSILTPDWIFGACRLDKCSMWGFAIGNLGLGNSLGLYFSFLTIACVVFLQSPLTRLIAACSGVIVVDLCVSRSALLALAGSLCLVALKKALMNRVWISGSALFVITSIGILLPTARFSGGEFTERAALWGGAMSAISKSPLVGYGPSAWVRQGTVEGTFANYSVHNIWLENAFALGLAGAALFGALLLGWKHQKTELSFALVIMTGYFLTLGILEVPSGFTRTFVVPQILTLLLLMQRRLRAV